MAFAQPKATQLSDNDDVVGKESKSSEGLVELQVPLCLGPIILRIPKKYSKMATSPTDTLWSWRNTI